MFRAKMFLENNVGGPAEVHALIATRFAPPSVDAVRKWFTRDAISGEWFPVVVALLESKTGAPVSLKKYLSEGGRR